MAVSSSAWGAAATDRRAGGDHGGDGLPARRASDSHCHGDYQRDRLRNADIAPVDADRRRTRRAARRERPLLPAHRRRDLPAAAAVEQLQPCRRYAAPRAGHRPAMSTPTFIAWALLLAGAFALLYAGTERYRHQAVVRITGAFKRTVLALALIFYGAVIVRGVAPVFFTTSPPAWTRLVSIALPF